MSDYNIQKESVLRVTFGLKGGAGSKVKVLDKKEQKIIYLKNQVATQKKVVIDNLPVLRDLIANIERVGSLICKNDAKQVFDEVLQMSSVESLQKALEDFKVSNDENVRLSKFTENLFSSTMAPVDNIIEVLAGSKEGFTAVVSCPMQSFLLL